MDRVRSELQPYLDATAAGTDEFSGRHTRRTGGLVARSATCRELMMHPLVLGTIGNVLKHLTRFQLHLTQIIAIGAGEPMQMIHRDQWAYDFFPFPKGYEVQCNTIWAMTDFTAENGATRVIPGQQPLRRPARVRRGRHASRRRWRRARCSSTPAASITAAGANRSADTRYGINITYNSSWLRQEENQYLSVPLEIARTLPVDLLRLIGYARGAYALGYVDDLRDPIEVVRPDLASNGLGDLAASTKALRRRINRNRE